MAGVERLGHGAENAFQASGLRRSHPQRLFHLIDIEAHHAASCGGRTENTYGCCWVKPFEVMLGGEQLSDSRGSFIASDDSGEEVLPPYR